MKYAFVCEEHKEFGSLGWRLEDKPYFDPLGGMAVAHDILEHFPRCGDTIHDELQALGASLWVRESYPYNGNPGENIASDFPMIFAHAVNDSMELRQPPRTYRLPDYVEREIHTAVQRFKRMKQDGDWVDEDGGIFKRAIQAIPGWLRIGYRRAVRRYHGLDQASVCYLFRTIQTAADNTLKYAEEGERLIVSVDIRHYRARIIKEERSDEY
jgi:hypothetical protein